MPMMPRRVSSVRKSSARDRVGEAGQQLAVLRQARLVQVRGQRGRLGVIHREQRLVEHQGRLRRVAGPGGLLEHPHEDDGEHLVVLGERPTELLLVGGAVGEGVEDPDHRDQIPSADPAVGVDRRGERLDLTFHVAGVGGGEPECGPSRDWSTTMNPTRTSVSLTPADSSASAGLESATSWVRF